MSAALPERRSGRVLLIDDARRLLFFHARESMSDGSTRSIWFLPGGGAENDESFAECAARELYEETGLRATPAELGKVAAVRHTIFSFQGVRIASNEVYFIHVVPTWNVDTAGFTDLEREVVHEYRWWTLPELRATNEIVFPQVAELAALLEQFFTSGIPAEPVRFSG